MIKWVRDFRFDRFRERISPPWHSQGLAEYFLQKYDDAADTYKVKLMRNDLKIGQDDGLFPLTGWLGMALSVMMFSS